MRKNLQNDTSLKVKAQARRSSAKSQHRHDSSTGHLSFERLISNLSARFVNIAPEMVDGEIEQSLRQVLEFFQVDRCALLKTLPGRKSWQIAFVAYAEGVPPLPEKTALPMNLFPWVSSQVLDRHKVVVFRTPDDLPPEAAIDKQTYHSWRITSSLTIPILISGSADYGLAINAVSHECVWSEDYISRLRLLGEVFVNALERRRIDQSLQESEARLSLAADSAGAMLWSLTIDSGHIWTTEKAKEFFGFAPGSDMDLESFLNVVHPEDREKLRLAVEETMRSGKDSSAEYRIMRPDRNIRWVLSFGRPYPASQEEPARLMGVSIDLTERKLAEAARLESTERHSAIVEAFDGLIYICSPDYRVEFMNQRMIERTGRNAVGEYCYKALHDRDSICEWCVNERVFQGETVRWEVQSPKDLRWYYVVNTPIRHADETMSKQSMIMDITERKQAEETLKKSEAALRISQQDLKRLAGRLISVQEEELRRLSRELHDDLTQKLAVLAIEAGKLERELKKSPGSSLASSKKLSEIKDQLIRVSEEVHQISRQIHPSILDDLGLVRAIESECAAFLKREDIKVTLVKEDDIPAIPTETALCLYRVVQESLKNISKHSGAKNAEISLKGTDKSILLSIRDKGIGFDAQKARQKKGLGLASMRERVQLVRGDFSVESRPGHGTVINVRVPLMGDGE